MGANNKIHPEPQTSAGAAEAGLPSPDKEMEPVKPGETVPAEKKQEATLVSTKIVEKGMEPMISRVMLKQGLMRRPRLGLHEAIQRGQEDVVKQICLERCGQKTIDECSGTGASVWNETPLMVACQAYYLPRQTQLNIINLLLESGASLTMTDEQSRSPLALAVLSSPDSRQPRPHVLSPWLSQGEKVLFRSHENINKWSQAFAVSSKQEPMASGGGIVKHTVRLPCGETVHNVIPSAIVRDVPAKKKELELGGTVLFKEMKSWKAGVICAINRTGGYDVRSISLKDPKDLRQLEADNLLHHGLGESDLRVPPHHPSPYRPATEGMLFPGCNVFVFLPNWAAFRTGMVQGRNTFQGGFNILLAESVDKDTGSFISAPNHRWLTTLTMKNKGETLNIAKLLRSERETPTNRSRLLLGVRVEWIRVHAASRRNTSCTPLVVRKLCEERRADVSGRFKVKKEFGADEKAAELWEKQEARRACFQFPEDRLSGTQVVAIAARYSNIAVLMALGAEENKIIEDKEHLVDWHEGEEASELITDPEVANFFLKKGSHYSLAKAVRLCETVKRDIWITVVENLLGKANEYAWAVTSPPTAGLNAVGWACYLGRHDVLAKLLEKGGGLYSALQPYKPGQHPLFLGVRAKKQVEERLKLVELLLEKGVRLEGSHALAAAVDEDCIPIIELLIQHAEKSKNTESKEGGEEGKGVAEGKGGVKYEKYNGVHVHDLARSYTIIKLLYPEGALDMLPVTIVLRALSHAAGSVEYDGWLELLERVESDWQAWNDKGHTALSLAVKAEDATIVEQLLKPGRCDPNVRTSTGEYPIGIACNLNESCDVLRLILGYQYVVYIGGTLAVPRVCKRAKAEMLDCLIDNGTAKMEAGLDLNEGAEGASPSELLLNRPEGDNTPKDTLKSMLNKLVSQKAHVQVGLVASYGWRDILSSVLTRSDNELIRPVATPGKMSALMHSILRGDNEMVRFLVRCKADLLQTDESGKSVLVVAIEAELPDKPDEDRTRCAVLKELLDEAPISLVQANGVLAAAAKTNSLEMISLLNDKTDGKWCEEDEMVIDERTNMRVSPIDLASDQSVQRKLIDIGFKPNIANFAKQGKFELLLHATEHLQETTSSTQKKAILSQRSTIGDPDDTKDHVGRSALAWVCSTRFECMKNVSFFHPHSDVKALRFVSNKQLEAWGLRPEPGTGAWLSGTIRPSTTKDNAYKVGDVSFTGIVNWKPDFKPKNGARPILTAFHDLVFNKKNNSELKDREGFEVLVKVTDSQIGAYQRAYLDHSLDDNHWMVTTGAVRTSAGEEVEYVQPREVASSHIILFVKYADRTNEEAAGDLLKLVTPVKGPIGDKKEELVSEEKEESVSSKKEEPVSEKDIDDIMVKADDGTGILELAASGGDVKLCKFILKEIPEHVNPDRRGSINRRESTIINENREIAHPCAAALCAAAASRKLKVCKMLIDGYAYAHDTREGWPVGRWAASECIVSLLRQQWEKDAPVGSDDLGKMCDLSEYCRRGWTTEVPKLLERFGSEEVNQVDEIGRTPLAQAARGGHVKLVECLLTDHRPHIDVFDKAGASVLSAVAQLSISQPKEAISIMKFIMETEKLSYLSTYKCNEKTTELQLVVKRSKALSIVLAAPSPCVELVRLLLENGSEADEMYNGRTALRQIGSAAKQNQSDRNTAQAGVASVLLEKMFTWEVSLNDPKSHLYGERIPVLEFNYQSERYRIKEGDSHPVWINKGEVKEHKGSAACGKMLHLDFMHVVSMGWEKQVGNMVDLGAIGAYHLRALPYVCSDTLKSALLQCLNVLRPVWEKKEDLLSNARDRSQLAPQEWYVLRHLLRGLNNAHSTDTEGPTLQQAVNELLEDEKDTLRLLPLWLYREAIADYSDDGDKTFYSELFVLHQHKLKVELCEAWGQSLMSSANPPPRPCEKEFEVFKDLYTRGKELESAGCTLEIAAEYGWVEAVEWLVKEKKVNVNDTNTANKPIKTVALEIDRRIHEITGQILRVFFSSREVVDGLRYVLFMQNLDDTSKVQSLNDAVINTCRENTLLRALVGVAMVLFSHGADADPDDLNRLSQVMRLDQHFDATLHGDLVEGASLLHIAAACENATSLMWLLNNPAYADTLGTGVIEDLSGRTARHYTGSHDCHRILAVREQAQQAASGYMPPSEQINLVIALRVEKVLDFDLVNILRERLEPSGDASTIGESTVLHALHSLDLAGFIVSSRSGQVGEKLAEADASAEPAKAAEAVKTTEVDEADEAAKAADLYIVVSGSDRRNLLTCKRVPYLRSSIGERELLSKERHSIAQHIVNSFTWPVLDLELQNAAQSITRCVELPMTVSEDEQNWIRTEDWMHYGHEVKYSEDLRIACSESMQFSGEYKRQGKEPVWMQVDNTHRLKVENGVWKVTRDGATVMQHDTPLPGKLPLGTLSWRVKMRGTKENGAWKVEPVTVSVVDAGDALIRWEVVDRCNNVVCAIAKDRNPDPGRPALSMVTRLEKLVTSLPDGTPQQFTLSSTVYREIEGTYVKDTQGSPLGWLWKRESPEGRAPFKDTYSLKATFIYTAGLSGSEGKVKSLWTLSKLCPDGKENKAQLHMKSDDVAPWHAEGKWVNAAASETPADIRLDFTLTEDVEEKRAAEILLVKTNAMWGLRQLFLAAGVSHDDLPFGSSGRLKPDASSNYHPPTLINPGIIPPGQKWLDLLVQEKNIVQVFGVHNDNESDKILEEWQPNRELGGWSCYVKPWLWQPFCSIQEFLLEHTDLEAERKYDKHTNKVCDRKTFLNLQPLSSHSSSHWEQQPRMHVCAMPVKLFFEKDDKYFGTETTAAVDAGVLGKGHELLLNNSVGNWGDVSVPIDTWWLPIGEGKNSFLRRVDESGCTFEAMCDVPYYSEVSKQRLSKKVISDVAPLPRGETIEVIHQDLEGEWAMARHHDNSVYFKSYWLPLVTPDGLRKTLRPFYLSQVTSLESYMGSKIAFYFTFTATYISFLLLLLMTGILFALIQAVLGWYESEKLVIWNAFVVIMWGAVFRQRWMRKATELAYMWNVRNVEQWEPPMAEYLKRNANLEKSRHAITGSLEPYIPNWKRRWWYLVSVNVTGVMATAVVFGMYFNVVLRDTYAKKDTLLKLAFGVQNAMSIAVMDAVFAIIAEKLNRLENHRTKSSLQGSAIIKSFVFRFINGFSGLVITVFRTPTEICDCHVDCDPVCKTKDIPWDIKACEDAVTTIRSCISESRQSDIVVQLTTMLVIQSLLSILFEKAIPRMVLLGRQKSKKEFNKEADVFPKALGCLATTPIEIEQYKVVKHGTRYKYNLKMAGNFEVLKKFSKQYGGEWRDPNGVRYVATHDVEAEKVSFAKLMDLEQYRADSLEASPPPDEKTREFAISRGGDLGWSKLEHNSYDSITITTASKETFTLTRDVEIREGMLSSEPSPLTLSLEDRSKASIPKEATHFLWVYGLTQQPQVEDKQQKAVDLIDALGQYKDAKLASLHAVVFGAYVYLDADKIVGINSVVPNEVGLAFQKPSPWNDAFTENLWKKGRFRPITVEVLRKAGARWYCWLNPGEELQSKTSGQSLWMASKSGAFVYLFDPDDDKRYAEGALPAHPPKPHPKNRLFSVRVRQVDSTMAVILETMKPPTSEEKEFNDYTMMMLQFAYVVCFASVGPMTPFVAIVTGSIELHTDLLKFLKLTQRPEAMKASGIGAWLTLLTAIIYFSIPVNALIVLKGYGWRSYANNSTEDTQVIMFLGMLGAGIAVVTLIRFLLKPTAAWVVQHELRKDYEKLQEIPQPLRDEFLPVAHKQTKK